MAVNGPEGFRYIAENEKKNRRSMCIRCGAKREPIIQKNIEHLQIQRKGMVIDMHIIIVGCGNVGSTIVEKLSKEGHNITVIDTKSEAIKI